MTEEKTGAKPPEEDKANASTGKADHAKTEAQHVNEKPPAKPPEEKPQVKKPSPEKNEDRKPDARPAQKAEQSSAPAQKAEMKEKPPAQKAEMKEKPPAQKAEMKEKPPAQRGEQTESPPKRGEQTEERVSLLRQHGVRMLLFNRWDTSDVALKDAGLKKYMNLDTLAVPRTGGRYNRDSIQKRKISVIERFMNKLMVAGHRGKKHKITSGNNVGKTPRLYNSMKEAFILIEKRTKQNPVQVLVGAIENAALLEEVASYRLGGIIARNSVIASPQRRLDIALRHLSQGIYRASFRKTKSLSQVIAEELIAAYNNDSKSFSVSERNRIEKEAEGAR